MSRQLALETIWLKPTPRLGHTEYSLGYHTDYVRKKTGLEMSDPNCMKKFYELWGIDFNWSVHDGLHGDWGRYGRATDMGHAEYAPDGSDLRQPQVCPFKTVEDVWAFDAVAEYGLPDFNEQVEQYEQSTQSAREAWPDQLTTGGYYKTIVSGGIQAFGWDMFLEAAADRKRMEPVFDSIFRFTKHHMDAWAKTSAEVIIQHDDFVWSEGAFMHPDEVYRKVIIPRFAELWKPLKAAGKKVLFCSDANFTEFMQDLVEAGADGFIFEPMNDFEWVVDRFGDSKLIIGSCVDCRDLAFSPWETVKTQLDNTFKLAKKCRGLIFSVGNHMPANIPQDMMDKFIEYLQANWQR